MEENDIQAWLSSQPHSAIVPFATRSALRMLPTIGASFSYSLLDDSVLPLLRMLITSAATAKFPNTVLDRSTFRINIRPDTAFHDGSMNHDGRIGHSYGGKFFALSSIPLACNIALSSRHLETARREALSLSTWDSAVILSRDMGLIDLEDEASQVFGYPLWQDAHVPQRFSENLSNLKDFLGDKRGVWGFWERWYDGFLSGRPINWDIQLAVATLPEKDWEKGPKWIAGKIAEIEARVALQDRIADLDTALLSENAQQRGIGDNSPPEPIQDIGQVPPELVVIWEPLQSLQQETLADVPDAGRVRRAIRTLVDVAVSCGAWTWEKANVFLDSGLKAGGAAASVAFVTGHGDKIVAVIKAAIEWLTFWA